MTGKISYNEKVNIVANCNTFTSMKKLFYVILFRKKVKKNNYSPILTSTHLTIVIIFCTLPNSSPSRLTNRR